LTASEGDILGQDIIFFCIVECITSTSIFTLRCKTLLYRNLNQLCNILILEHLIYGLYVCICVFLLHQKSFDMILENIPSLYDGGVIAGGIFLIS
jgi:hypothetical protein